MDASIKGWRVFLDNCLKRRLRAQEFEGFATELSKRNPLKGRKLAELVLSPSTRSTAACVDPLLPVYLDRLLALDQVDVGDILEVAYKHSKDYAQKISEDAAKDGKQSNEPRNPSELEEIIFHRLAKAFQTGERPQTVPEVQRSWTVLAAWMPAMATAHTGDSVLRAMAGETQDSDHVQQEQAQLLVREAFGMLLLAMVENQKAVGVMAKALPKEVVKRLASGFAQFVPFWAQSSATHASRLDDLRRAHGMIEDPVTGLNDANGEKDVGLTQMQLGAIVDAPDVYARASLYIFTNALLVARPLTDDNLILSYLNVRYKGDTATLATELITASFDILANGMYRGEPSQTMFSLKSFLINKVPHLLVMCPLLNPEFCISNALSRIDSNAFPSFSQSFDVSGGNTSLADIRQDFLFSCVLHQLIPGQSVERLLGEQPMAAPPAGGRYAKENLIAQCAANPERVETIINELGNLDGQAASIVAAVTNIIRNQCVAKETMSLKTICNALSRKPQALDVMLQFTSPASILQPLCQLLDTWTYEDDQGEYQPVYEEFGAILLLVLAFVHRHELTYIELGIPHNSFIAQLLEQGHLSKTVDELSNEQSNHIGAWIRGLSSSEGISDDLMSSCRPQDFYMLVPTLFNQTVFACSADILGIDTVKGGLEYLLETFLITSLIGAITWMTAHALRPNHNDVDIIIQILHKIIRPTSISGESQSMHGTILAITSRKLEKMLQTLKRRHPQRQDIEQLLQAVAPHLNYERTAYSTMAELDQWTKLPGNTFKTSLRNTIRELVEWSSAATLTLNQPSYHRYTHRQLFVGVKLLGAKKTLLAIIDEVKAQTEAGSGPLALDVAASLICAPSVENSPISVDWMSAPVQAPQQPRTRMNLQEMLKAFYDDEAPERITTDTTTAETIVRLHRRVEAQLATAPPMPLHDLSTQLPGTQLGVEGMGDMPTLDPAEQAAAEAVVADMTAQQDLDSGAGGMDLTSGAPDAMAPGLEGMSGLDSTGTGLETGGSPIAVAAAGGDSSGMGTGTGADAGTGGIDLGTLGTEEDPFAGLGTGQGTEGDPDDIWAGLDFGTDLNIDGF